MAKSKLLTNHIADIGNMVLTDHFVQVHGMVKNQTKTMENLKIGDRLWANIGRYGEINYRIVTVERLTKTQIVCSDGERLRVSRRGGYEQVAKTSLWEWSANWHILTPEKEAEIMAYREQQRKLRWVSERVKTLTVGDKLQIYELFNK